MTAMKNSVSDAGGGMRTDFSGSARGYAHESRAASRSSRSTLGTVST